MSVTDSILQAISITAKSEINKVKSDVTRQYVISDIIDADKGIYKASTTTGNTNLQIEVYRRAGDAKLYQVGDSVDVHIPEGDYTRTKTIISTYATSGGGAATTSSSSGEETEQEATSVLGSWITLNSVNLEETADSPAVALDLSYKKLDFSDLSDGATITSIDYALGADNINVPAEGWQKPAQPTPTKEKPYIWIRTTWDSNNKVVYTYLQVKEKTYTNLVRNGYGENQDNTNFTWGYKEATVEDKSILGNDVYGYFSSDGKTIGYTEEKIPYNIKYGYDVEFYYRRKDEKNAYFGIVPLDIDGKQITNANVMNYNWNLFYLAQDLEPGDSVVHFTDLTNWNVKTTQDYQRNFLFFGYADSTGYIYPDGTYSRYLYFKVYESNDNVNVADKTITLKESWSGQTFKAGTAVAQVSDGATFCYIGQLNTNIVLNEWKKVTGTISEKSWDASYQRRMKYAKSFKLAFLYGTTDIDFAKILVRENLGDWDNYYCLAPNGVYLRLAGSTAWSDLETQTWEELSSKSGFELGSPSAYSSSLIYYQRLKDVSGTREVSSQEITPEKPIYTCNYNSVRLRGAYKIQLGDKSTKISTWPYWEMYLYVYDGLAGRHFKYPFTIGQDYLSSYMTTAKSIPEDIIINFDENNLRIDKYCFKIEISEESELKDGADNDLSSAIIKWNNPVAEFGWNSSEYADAVYIYEVDNKKFFDGETTLQLAAKINYNKKEYTISEAIAALMEAEKINYHFCWATDNSSFASYQQDDTLYAVKPNAVTSLVSYTGGLYNLGLSETETVLTDSMWQNAQSTARISSALTFDYSKNLWYNYNMKIISTNGLVVTTRPNQANTTTQLVAQIYRGGTLLSGPVKEPETSAEYNDATIYYTETEEAGTIIKSYWIFEAPGTKRNVSIQWYKNMNLVAADSENAFRTIAIKSDETGTYKCDITIGDKGVIYGS